MDATPLTKIAEYAGAVLTGGSETSITCLSTNSRTLQPGDLFVALRGENFDGHKFLAQAIDRGAVGAVVAADWSVEAKSAIPLLRVPDTLIAYQQIAANYRKQLPLQVIAITGSNGKTSTKDFVASVLARRFRVTKTQGNFNNHVGLPKTMLDASATDEVAVWEIGMNHPGEIATLAALARPDLAIITNIGVAHLEFMGTREAIALEKGSLAEAIGASGTVILSGDDPFSGEIAARTRARTVLAGIKAGSVRALDVSQTSAGSEFTVMEGAHRCRAQLPVPGLHMVQNALLAISAGRAFGIALEDCAAGLASAPLTKARLQIKDIRGVQFIDDSYNANPDSMKAALQTLVELEADGRRVAVLGAMGELGVESEWGHQQVGEAAATLKIDCLIAVGEVGGQIAEAARAAGLENVRTVATASEASELLSELVAPGDLVLVKGSRSARMELVLEDFAQHEPAEELAR